MKDIVIKYIDNPDNNLEDIENTLEEGIKKRFCIEGLYFFYMSSYFDGYNMPLSLGTKAPSTTITVYNTGNVEIGTGIQNGPIHISTGAPNIFTFPGFGGTTSSFPKLRNHNRNYPVRLADDTCLLRCSVNRDNIKGDEVNVYELIQILKDLEAKDRTIHFVELNKTYDNLYDLKHDFLAYKLSGLK